MLKSFKQPNFLEVPQRTLSASPFKNQSPSPVLELPLTFISVNNARKITEFTGYSAELLLRVLNELKKTDTWLSNGWRVKGFQDDSDKLLALFMMINGYGKKNLSHLFQCTEGSLYILAKQFKNLTLNLITIVMTQLEKERVAFSPSIFFNKTPDTTSESTTTLKMS